MSATPAGDTGARRAGAAALLLICAGQFMLVLDISIVNVALPTIQRRLGMSQAELQWIVTGYTLTFGGFLLLGGRMADVFGRRRMFMLGLALFASASLVGGLAQSGVMLILSRGVQGLGGAMVSPAALSLLTTTFHEGPERNRAIGIWGAVAASGGAVGVLMGGILTELVTWRWVFLVNVPVAAVVIALAPRVLAEGRGESKHRPDLPGAATVTAGLVALVFGLSQGGEHSFSDPRAWVALLAAAVLLAVFVAIEQRVSNPLLPFRIFRVSTVVGADLGMLLLAASMFGMVFFLTLYLQRILRLSPIQTGLAWLPMTAFIATSAQLATRFVGRIGVKPLFAGGLLLSSGGMALLSGVSAGGSYAANALPGLVLVSIGMGLAFTTATVAATAGISDGEQGLASGLLVTSQQVGASIGLAVLTAIAAAQTRASVGPPAVALVDGFQLAFRVAIGFGIAGAVAVVALVHDDACLGELRRRKLRALMHRQIAQPVSGQTSPCWPAVADLHQGRATVPAEAVVDA
ncbi:MAG: MFS transporter [Solirubrobacterales bacterium]|nr:MFS transporter [Solirubrobacterales bacterium]